MRRHFTLLFLLLCFLPQACKRVSVHMDDGYDKVRITVPLFLVFKALRYSEGDVLEIDDLGGIEEDIPLHALAQAIRDGGDRIKVDFKQGDTRIAGEKRGNVFHIEMDNPEEEEKLRLNLPVALMDAFLDAEDGQINERQVKRALKRYSGVLLEVESPYEKVRIVLR